MSVEDTFSARLKELLNSTNTSTVEAIDCLSEMCENVLYYSYMLCIQSQNELETIEYKYGPLVAAMRLHSSRKASLADCCFQAIDIQSTSKNTVIYKCQCILCGNECTAFTASDNGGSYKWNTHSNYCDMMFEINDKIFAIVYSSQQQPAPRFFGSQTVTLIQASIQVGISTY